ncbi:MAG: glycoside hydrolase family 2 TIM barrel-domain containing protein [Bacteroidaceae bacterium]|nr:glycoside hydrolase family 2 TIM barrel-domain containing protein [Bacteroidaceae bacterium]
MNKFLRPIIAMALSLALPPVTVHAQYIEKQEGAVKANVPVSDFTDYKHKLFNFGWRFCLGNPEGAESVDFDDSSWRTLDLPHDYQFEQPWEENENKGRGFKRMCEGWYRKTFTVPETLKGRRVLLDFEGVMYVADVYVNGKKVASNEYGYTGFEADISKVVNYGGDNVVAVYSNTGAVNASRWYTGGGIYRNVWLVTTNDTRIARHGLYVSTEGDKVKVQVQVVGWQRHDIRVVAVVKDAQGHVIAESERVMPDHTIQNNTEVMMPDMKVASPQLWDINSPTLYSVEAKLVEDGMVIDSVSDRFGFRTIEYGPDFGFKLNGRKVFLAGIANHHDMGAVGVAAYRTAVERQLRTLKSFGYNAIRCSHNPYSDDFYRIADEVGLLVVDELIDKWSDKDYWGGRKPFMSIWPELIKEWVKRGRNHPSVVLWSLGNELQTRSDWSGYQTDDWGITTYRIFDQMVKRYDRTRPTTVAMFPARAGAQRNTPDFKTYLVPPELACATEVASFNYQWDAYHGYYDYKPDLILFQSEAVTNQQQQPYYGMDQKRGVGLCWWGAIEYWGESNGWPKKGWNYSFFSHTLHPYPQAYLIKSCIQPEEKLVHIGVVDGKGESLEWNDIKVGQQKVSRNWNQRSGSHPNVFTYTNADEVELFYNGKSLGVQKNDTTVLAKRNVILWSGIDYRQGGKLVAVARNGGKEVARDVLETTGKAVALKVVEEEKEWMADGMSLKYINIYAVDSKGREVPNATDSVRVDVKGEACFVALDNGDHYTDELFLDVKAKKMQAGYMQCILRSTRNGGKVKLKVSSPTLKAANLNMETK